MSSSARRSRLVRTGSLALSLALAACEHGAVTAPGASGRPAPVLSQAIHCTADLRAGAVACDDGSSGSAGASATPSLVLGGQGTYVSLASSNPKYDAATGAFTFDVTVFNRIQQPLGTADGTTPDANGVRVFLTADPSVTSGSGTVTAVPDGRATFTASAQPYWQYDGAALGGDGRLDYHEMSGARSWRFDIAGAVNSFAFTLYVSAAVPHPDGWMTVSPSSVTLAPGDSAVVSASAYTFSGAASPDPIGWSSSDTSVAVVRGGTRIVARASGSAVLTASQGSRTATVAVTVAPPGARLVRIAGDGFSAKVLSNVTLTVRAVDANGQGMAGTIVGFALSAPAHKCTNCPDASLTLTSATTDDSGYVSTVLHLGTSAGQHVVTATVPGMPSSQFNGWATPDTYCSAQISGGGTAYAGDSLPLTGRATDQYGNGVAYGFGTLGTRGGPAGFAYGMSTDTSGIGHGWWVLGPTVGGQQLLYTGQLCQGLGTYPSPLTARGQTYSLNATALSTQPVIGKVSGDSASVSAGSAAPLAARVQDYHGNTLAGVVVTWALSSGSGTLSATSDTSDANGLVQTTLTTSATPGRAVVTASATGAAGASFTVFGVAESTAAIALVNGNAQVAAIGGLLHDTLLVRVTDAGGTYLAGRTVTWSVTSGGGAIQGLGPSDQYGLARAIWKAGTAGAQTATATLQGGTANTVAFSSTAIVFTQVSVGFLHGCGLTADGLAWCWGNNGFGQLGINNNFQNPTWPTKVVTNERFKAIAAGEHHTCALRTDGAAFCWGDNSLGQLGTGDLTSAGTPRTVTGGQLFTAISTHNNSTCAIDANGAAWCWGENRAGQLGKGTASATCQPGSSISACEKQPTAVAGGHLFQEISVGGRDLTARGCGVDTAGAAWCWGAGSTAPPALVSGGRTYTAIAADGYDACAVGTDQTVYCALMTAPTPVPGMPAAMSVDVGDSYACALARTGAAYCWGDNGVGQFGSAAAPSSSAAAVSVDGGHVFTTLSSGSDAESCGTATDGRSWCWGAVHLGVYNPTLGSTKAPRPVAYILPPAGM